MFSVLHFTYAQVMFAAGESRSAGLMDATASKGGVLKELSTKNGVDLASRNYTGLLVPAEVTVKPSGIPGPGLGVFANVLIPIGVEMGPYEGKVVKEEHMASFPTSSYAWEVIIHSIYVKYPGKDLGCWGN